MAMFVKSCYRAKLSHISDTRPRLPVWLPRAAMCIALLAVAPARADDAGRLVELINDYRAAPGTCEGRPADPVEALAAHPALARVQVATGTFLQPALELAGYRSQRAQAISVSGPPDAKAAMAVMQQKYCATLLSAQFTAVGATRHGNDWQVVFAQPLPTRQLADLQETGKIILAAVNGARATARRCGGQEYAAVPPLRWNAALGDAALEHSRDMATHRYFQHQGTDGSVAADRARRAGYAWRRIGENIASGQDYAEEAVAGWLSSPGHCANIMNRDFSEMGAAYAVNPGRERGVVYWTQVLGSPR
ncbi:MAG: CAP domain-containing protein [Massilia sp.]